MRYRIIAVLLGFLLALAGCTQSSPQPLTSTSPELASLSTLSPNQVVFQINPWGGYMNPFGWASQMPEFTLFSDGRVIFVDRDEQGAYQVLESRLPEAQYRSLIARADRDLTGLNAHYTAAMIVDSGETTISLFTGSAFRRVSVYAFGGETDQSGPEQAVIRKLLSLCEDMVQAARANSGPYTPERVTLLAERWESPTWPAPPRPWPDDLVSIPEPPSDQAFSYGSVDVSGEMAQRLARQVPYRANWLYQVGSQFFAITVRPVIPKL